MKLVIAPACMVAFLALAASPVATAADADPALAARVQQLEAREAIRMLFNDYGRLIDARDFAGFAALFAADAEYGGAANIAKGPAAIRAQLEGALGSNALGVGSPNFHIFFNESIRVDGDRATSVSKGAFVAPGENGRPQMIILATYDDTLIREGGQWKFLRRIVRGDLPAARAPAPTK